MGFFEEVYKIVKMIPKGKVATYGQIASLTDNPKKSIVIGWALHSNPYPGVVPCHRIVDRNGRLSGSFAFGGIDAQRKLLEDEGVVLNEEGRVDLEIYLWKP
jgi:methylated-DNA-protein-cysteine methyltransferase-like protein